MEQTLSLHKPVAHIEKHIDLFARFGYLARAIIYGFMGILALMMLTGQGGKTTDSKGAIQELLSKPFGEPIVLVVAAGLFGYAIFRIFQAVHDYENHGSDAKGIGHRIAYFFGGVMHILLGIYALNLVFVFGKNNSNDESGLAQMILNLPMGQILLFAVAAIIVGFGVSQFIIAIKEKFTRGLHLPEQNKKVLCNISKFGLIARGIMFLTVGWLFVKAAIHANSAEAKGIKGAWSYLGTQPFGNWLELLIAVGLIAFAFYGIIEAKYRHIRSV